MKKKNDNFGRSLLASFLLAPSLLFASTITYEYDALDRLIQVSYGNGTMVQYSYDPAGNRTQRVVSASATTLNVSVAGTGAGTITSSPAGIDCGSSCTAEFTSGAEVTLTALAAPGSTFAGWTGGCAGTTSTCTVTMDAAQSMTATFSSTLSSGGSVTSLSGLAGSAQSFAIEVPSGADTLTIRVTGGVGQVELYVRFGALATLTEYDCYQSGDASELICTIDNPLAGTYFVTVIGVTDFSGVRLEASSGALPGHTCSTDEDYTLTFGPQPGATKEVLGCRRIIVESGVLVAATGILHLEAREQILFRAGFRVALGGQLSAKAGDVSTMIEAIQSDMPLTGAECAGYGVCGIEFTLNEGIDLAQVELSVDWGDGSSSSAMGLQQCVQLGICGAQGDRRYRLWRRYESAGSHLIQFAYRYGSQPFDTAHYAANVGLDADFLLRATAGDQEVTVEWPTVGADAYNLCRSGVSVGVFDNCYVVGGRPVDVDIGLPPQVVSGLTNFQPYFFQVEAQFGNQRLLSNEASATPGTQTVARRQLTDTGILWCAGQNSSLLTCPVAGFPEQDGEHGRDVLAAAGQLDKIGFGSAAMDYTKIGNDGTELAESASLGTAPGDWGCTRDNLTGLWWEVKQTEQGHLRHVDNTYTWFEAGSPDGQPGTADGGVCSVGSCDTADFVNAVNAQGLCGRNDWRLPAIEELHSIGYLGQASPTIDLSAFPNTPASRFWSGSVDASSALNAWAKDFAIGGDRRDRKSEAWAVRLVRGGT